MIDKKEKTAPNVSVGADTEQSIQKCTDNIITDYDENIKIWTKVCVKCKEKCLGKWIRPI